MELLLIENERAGSHDRAGGVAEGLRSHGARVTSFGLDPDSIERAKQAHAERVVVAGGDGSLGLAAEVAHALDVPLAVIPTGTANDFARHQELPMDSTDACRLAVTGTRTRKLDLGRLTCQCSFVNAATTGLSAAAATEARPLKKRLGALAYAAGAARAAARARPIRCRVIVDGDAFYDAKSWQVVIGITGAFGGGSEIGTTDPQDGMLDVAVVPAGSRIGLIRRAWGLRLGRVVAQRDVRHRRGREIDLELPDGTRMNVDGELIDASRRETATIVPGAYRLVVG